MGGMTKPEIRAAFHDVVEDRVPYYGEYMVENAEGEWVINEEYVGEAAVADPPAPVSDD
jgi:cyclic pyranopterin phosphate synthase